MKSYHLLSLSLLCSIGLTSCWSRTKNTNTIERMSVAPENNFATGQVHYLSDYITRDHSPENAFASLIQKGNVIIDFYADWCGPCKRLGTVLQEIAPVNLNVLIIKVDTDAYQTIAAQYNVRSLPTMIFFKNGRQIHRVTGFNSKAELASLINNLY